MGKTKGSGKNVRGNNGLRGINGIGRKRDELEENSMEQVDQDVIKKIEDELKRGKKILVLGLVRSVASIIRVIVSAILSNSRTGCEYSDEVGLKRTAALFSGSLIPLQTLFIL